MTANEGSAAHGRRTAVIPTVTRVELETDRGVFMISVAAQLAEMHPQTLRMYEARGLITPKRSPKGTRLYSQEDVDLLRRIQEMTAELGLNLAGVERVLALEEELEAARKRVETLEQRAQEAQADDRRNPQVTPEHLLSVLLEQEGGVVVPVLNKLGAGVAPIRADVNAALDAQPTLGEGGEPGGAGSELVAVLRAADKEAR